MVSCMHLENISLLSFSYFMEMFPFFICIPEIQVFGMQPWILEYNIIYFLY